MEIIAQQREEKRYGAARQAGRKLGHDKIAEPRTNTVVISKCLAMQSQRSVRGPFVYLFVNEGDETRQFIFGLCFPIVPIAAEKMPLWPESGELPSDWMKGYGLAGELGACYSWAGQLGQQAGYPATVALCRFSNFMKKEGKVKQLESGQLELRLDGTWRQTSRGGGGGGAGWRKREQNDVVEGEVEWREWIRQSEAK